MTPTFRSDLTCSREEQQGVVFYRIDDPKAQTSFRLYEIEYLIAKKLDGTRTLLEVIAAVKKEFNFDISEPDLQRFVNQLESMGFLLGGRDGEASVEQETAVMARPSKAPAAAPESLDLLDDAGGAEPHLDQAEFDRLLRSAFMHVKQGYIVHARDYFLAAKELNPTDDRLAKLVHHLEIIGDASGPAEVEYLWNQATELFPDVAARLGPFVDAHSGGTQVDRTFDRGWYGLSSPSSCSQVELPAWSSCSWNMAITSLERRSGCVWPRSRPSGFPSSMMGRPPPWSHSMRNG